ncbi:hypothetical protein MNEG_11020 [Monoraphidium neglectum]|uniref:Uncharacterized protein n=1 Tax=Monoraphidium neglectum TaxID=145388 RepID=A0A0D2KMK0_9CHLO|nr:hypothetical protein MNEG_11020 [Monoraphidium neglectum]KIY96943.1 hypothetical protein MNEG_11020 [Monoraphidium neglectum]|eukprot:XP_013895963.1 hypothetical protein MNEG_11020 [Monoraphidium neglectum]
MEKQGFTPDIPIGNREAPASQPEEAAAMEGGGAWREGEGEGESKGRDYGRFGVGDDEGAAEGGFRGGHVSQTGRREGFRAA